MVSLPGEPGTGVVTGDLHCGTDSVGNWGTENPQKI